jgi:site-specific DNA-methyltransferase (adenine-specific)
MTSIVLKNGDCLELMKTVPDGSVDLTVTSPPYDNLRTYNGNNDQWGEHVWRDVISNLHRVTTDGGVVVWVVGDATMKGSETGTSFKQALYAKEVGFNLHDTMIYEKDNPPPVGGSNRYYQNFEYMFVWSKGTPKTFNPIMRTRKNKWNDKRTERFKGFTRDKDGNFKKKKVSLTGEVKVSNIFKYVVGGGNSVEVGTKHPAAFPDKLANDQIISWSNEGDTVLDPFMGSGTTGISAKNLNRSFIGIELDKDYYNIAKGRIQNANPLGEFYND